MESPLPNAVLIREVIEADLPILFEQQLDPEATKMAAFPSKPRDAFMVYWAKRLADQANIVRTIVFEGQVAGNIGSWEESGQRLVGYWIGKEYWGKGIATRALSEFLGLVTIRPLVAYVAKHNVASRRVLEKCGFGISGEDRTLHEVTGEPMEELILKLS